MTTAVRSKRRQAVLDSVTISEMKVLVERFGIMGNAEAAEALGTAQPNLLRLSSLPEPVAQVKATRLWIGEEIREFAEQKKAARRKSLAA